MNTEKKVISINPTSFGSKLFLLQQSKKFCDATLLVNGERIDVHAHILAASSEFFEDIFVKSKEVTFKDVDKDIIDSLIEYCYRGTIEITELKIEKMIQMAQNLSITTFIESCKEVLQRWLNVDNCFLTWKISRAEKFDDLERVSLEFIKKNFLSISKLQQFLTLNYSDIEEVIEGAGLFFSDEDIYDAIKKWVNYDTSSRTKNLTNLLEHVHLECLPNDFLISESNSVCKLNPFCQEKFLKALESQKNYTNNMNTLIAVGSNSTSDARTMEVFNKMNQQWFEIKDMNCDREDFSTVFLNGKLLMIGGHESKNTVQSYDLASGKMETLPSLSHGRRYGSAVNPKGNVYFIGGFNGKPVSFVEKWNSKSWTDVASLNTARYTCGAAVLGDQIFVVGGFGNGDLSSTESYNSTTDKWEYCSNMNEARDYPGVAAVKGYLYAVGGKNKEYLKTTERYDPMLNRWTYIQSLEVGKRWMAASNFMGKLVIAGGKKENGTISIVENYDPEENNWKPMLSLQKPRRSFNLVEIPWTLAQLAISRNA